jgi:phosphohistidine phosphatase
MRLYLVQHGDAVAKDVDPERPLSDSGRADIDRLASWLERNDVRVARILHSGKLRAEQTANLLAPLAGDDGTVEAHPGLAPNDSPGSLLDILGDGDTIVAGHMPFVSRAVSLALELPPDQPIVAFKPGSLAGLERDANGSWCLMLFIRPEQV